MNRLIYAAVAALAVAASPAAATTYLTFNGTSGTFGNGDVAGPTFSDTFDMSAFPVFDIPAGYLVSLTISSSYAGTKPSAAGNIDFSKVTFNGLDFTKLSEGRYEYRTFDGSAGLLNTLKISGNSTGSASYAGTIDVARAVPEPATWAMMLAGFGLVGTAVRRRRTVLVQAI